MTSTPPKCQYCQDLLGLVYRHPVYEADRYISIRIGTASEWVERCPQNPTLVGRDTHGPHEPLHRY